MVFKQFPAISAKGFDNVEKMEQIYTTVKGRGHSSWSEFLVQAAIEKWDRDFHMALTQQHPTYANLIEIISKTNEYKIGRRFGQSITNAYKAKVISAKSIEDMYNTLELIKRDCLDSGAGHDLRKITAKAQNGLFQ